MSQILHQDLQVHQHSYVVELRFFGDGVDPAILTRTLGIEPSSSSDGTVVATASRTRRPYWAFNGRGHEGFVAEWPSLEDGLQFLLEKTSHARPAIIELSRVCKGVWWCGHFQSTFSGGPQLSPMLLGELASYKLPLVIDNYFDGPEDALARTQVV